MSYSHLFHNLKSMHFQTELLEACGWDDQELSKVIEKVTFALDNLKLPDIPCNFSFFIEKVLRPSLEDQKIDEIQLEIIIKYIEHDSKFVAHILSLPEN